MEIHDPVGLAKPDVIILSHQRSGTHFLESSLAAHPRIHKRGKCVMQYERRAHDAEACRRRQRDWIFTNRPDCVNVAIVMYSHVELFEEICGPLQLHKIIHLLRDAGAVARSCLQKAANQRAHSANYSAHCHLRGKPVAHSPVGLRHMEMHRLKVEVLQNYFSRMLKTHRNVLTIRYERLTLNRQMNLLPKPAAKQMLDFLGLAYYPLVNAMIKTGGGPGRALG